MRKKKTTARQEQRVSRRIPAVRLLCGNLGVILVGYAGSGGVTAESNKYLEKIIFRSILGHEKLRSV
jgi:hypothetical protein